MQKPLIHLFPGTRGVSRVATLLDYETVAHSFNKR